MFKLLLNYFPDPDILVNKDRMSERYELAKNNELPQEIMSKVSDTYLSIANKITKKEYTVYEFIYFNSIIIIFSINIHI